MAKQMRVGVKYWNEKNEAFYVVKMTKDGTIHSSTRPINYRPFSLNRATEIQMELESDGTRCIKIYE